MKRILMIALLVLATASSPVLAGGFFRTSPDGDTCDSCGKDGCKVMKGIGWVIKLPFRLIAATGYGLYDMVAHQELDGFEEGYESS